MGTMSLTAKLYQVYFNIVIVYVPTITITPPAVPPAIAATGNLLCKHANKLHICYDVTVTVYLFIVAFTASA